MATAYKKFWINFFNFKGRSTRSDYWYVVLINFVIALVFGLINKFIPQLNILSTIYYLATFMPGITLVIRRYHDINKSGWNYLKLLIPFVGLILVLIDLCKVSIDENNNYGERV